MNPVVTIELSDMTKINLVIADLVSNRGYFQHWTTNTVLTTLPFNCVWKLNTVFSDAIADVNLSIIAVNAQHTLSLTLVQALILDANPWKAI